ncbi:hypothetical protein K227x_27560 [Rubripirellula lacrimiformis]|uniref:Uncharacterized protein n=1 Tax=Rubripirellula lacrimiformis TaxID=1930273 RepID=A0A517NB59_9BACT|nr:hypothetical protein [Rubripirellula lacrimiformis]QDT04365.1 hypothetical protein K227x_27560 [Rubripirellula lacrimiformis]
MTDVDNNTDRLVETIPDDLLQLWRKGPVLFAGDQQLPVVELYGTILTLRWGDDVICCDARDCHFRIGRPWKMKHNARSARPLFPFGSHDLILIDFPPLHRTLFGRVWSYNTAAVGYTSQTLASWRPALATANATPNDATERRNRAF